MEALAPTSRFETALVSNEDWDKAQTTDCYWYQDDNVCDICKQPIIGRHMIDGKLRGSFMWGLMCASCHQSHGDGLGGGHGQLYSHLLNGKWLLTCGFPEDE